MVRFIAIRSAALFSTFVSVYAFADDKRCNVTGRYASPMGCNASRCDAFPTGSDHYIVSNGGGHTAMIPLPNQRDVWVVIPGPSWSGGLARSVENCQKIDFGQDIWTKVAP